MGYEALDETALLALPPPDAGRSHPAASRSCPSEATSSKATPRRPRRSRIPGPRSFCHRRRHPERDRGPRALDRDVLLSNHSVKAYGRDLMDFVRHMQAQGVDPLQVTADHLKCYKRALEPAGSLRRSPGGFRSSAAPTISSRPRASSPGRRPRTSPPSKPQVPEELDAVFDPAAGDLAPGGDPDRDFAGDPRPR